MIRINDEKSKDPCSGFIIDYDYATKINYVDGKLQGSFGGRTVG